MASTTSVQGTSAAQPAISGNRAAASALLKGAAQSNAGSSDFGPAAMMLAIGLAFAAIIFAGSHN